MTRIKSLPPLVKPLNLDTAKPAPKLTVPLYSSKGWLGLMARLKRQRGNACERCGTKGRVVGDHIIELKDGGAPLEETNIQLLCWPCHTTKTNQARAARIAKPLRA